MRATTQQGTLKTSAMKKIVFLLLIAVSVTTLSVHLPADGILRAAADDTLQDWTVNLRIAESSGVGSTISFGAKQNASDDQDIYDLPAPPNPPQFPFLLAWFETDFPEPFNRLLHEYKHLSSDTASWNLTFLWVPEPADTSTTTFHISWSPIETMTSGYDSFLLYQNNSVVADMYTDDSFTFMSNEPLHRLQILCQREPTDTTTTQPDSSYLFVLIAVLIILALTAALIITIKRRRK